MTVKHFHVEYNKPNELGTYSPGDTLTGQVIVVTTKETKVQCFYVRAKGKAKVMQCEVDGNNTVVHQDKKNYFYFEHIILQDKNKGDGSEIIGAGRNVFPFTFNIPNKDMPSSYQGKWGRITYSLRAQLTQSIWVVHKSKTEFPFLTKAEFPFASKTETMIIGLKEQQQATRISFCGVGKVTMIAVSERMGIRQGEAMGVSVEVVNESSRAVTPKLSLCEKQTFVIQAKHVVHMNNITFGMGDQVPPHKSHTVTKVLGIPPRLPPTFLNCSMMKLEYRLKVTLDVPQESGIKLPLVILLGLPKPHQQKPKRSIWFRNLLG